MNTMMHLKSQWFKSKLPNRKLKGKKVNLVPKNSFVSIFTASDKRNKLINDFSTRIESFLADPLVTSSNSLSYTVNTTLSSNRETNIIGILPEEMIEEVFSRCGDVKSIFNISLTCKMFRQLVNEANSYKCRCIQLLNIALFYNDQMKEDKIMTNYTPGHPAIQKIYIEDIVGYFSNIDNCNNKLELIKLFYQFKEKLIDAISDTHEADKLIPYDLSHLVPIHKTTPELREMRLDDILSIASKRIVGDVFLISGGSFTLVGERETTDRHGRRFGKYGTEGGVLPSIQVSMTNRWCNDFAGEDQIIHRILNITGMDHTLPAKLFLNAKEGDSVMIIPEGQNKTIKLFCRQKRYGPSENRFETELLRILNRDGISYNPNDYVPPISAEEQRNRLQQFRLENNIPTQ